MAQSSRKSFWYLFWTTKQKDWMLYNISESMRPEKMLDLSYYQVPLCCLIFYLIQSTFMAYIIYAASVLSLGDSQRLSCLQVGNSGKGRYEMILVRCSARVIRCASLSFLLAIYVRRAMTTRVTSFFLCLREVCLMKFTI